MNESTEPLAPLTDARVRELANLAHCGPDVGAMAQEVARSRERIVKLEAENAKGLANFDRMYLEAVATEKRLIMDLQYVRLVSVARHDALCAIALVLGLPAESAPDAVLAAAKRVPKLLAVCEAAEALPHPASCSLTAYGYPCDCELQELRAKLRDLEGA